MRPDGQVAHCVAIEDTDDICIIFIFDTHNKLGLVIYKTVGERLALIFFWPEVTRSLVLTR
jgi:hypothetical protein